MDTGAAFIKSVNANPPDAVICIDPFHVVRLVTTPWMWRGASSDTTTLTASECWFRFAWLRLFS